jgi:hypothetical protein
LHPKASFIFGFVKLRHVQDEDRDVRNGANINEVIQVMAHKNARDALQEKLANQHEDPNADAQGELQKWVELLGRLTWKDLSESVHPHCLWSWQLQIITPVFLPLS